jgi:hypothetical protein
MRVMCGWATSDRLHKELPINALKRAIKLNSNQSLKLMFDFTSFVALRVILIVARNIAPINIGNYSNQLLLLLLCLEKKIATITPLLRASLKLSKQNLSDP